MTEGEKSVISLFIIGALIVVGKVLAGGEPITARLFIGRTLLGGFVSMVAGVARTVSRPANCGRVRIWLHAGYRRLSGGRACYPAQD